MLRFIRFIFILLFIASTFPLAGKENENKVENQKISAHSSPVQIQFIQEEKSVQPGRPFFVVLSIKIEEGWHIYGQNPGDIGIPFSVDWKLPKDFQVDPIIWPPAERFDVLGMEGFGYHNEVVLLARITPSKEARQGTIQAKLEWLACSSYSCEPGSLDLSLSLQITQDLPEIQTEFVPIFTKARESILKEQEISLLDKNVLSEQAHSTNLPVPPTPPTTFDGGWLWLLIFAFIGGMILNLMPCVLPVLSFKVMSFVQMAGKSRSLTFKHGLVFSLGVIVSFWALASAMLLLRAYGQSVGWGFQLQEPLFVVILASLLFLFSLSLFGVFEWGLIFASWAGQTASDTTQKSFGFTGSFFSGVLATAVATPCTGPFLGSVVGFAVALPWFLSLLIFTVLGAGMSFPYLLLAAFPSWLRFMPKPGSWMETVKQFMGFLLLATTLWLIWVYSAQTNTLSLICLLAGFLFFSIAAWIYGKGCAPSVSRNKRLASAILVLLCFFAGGKAILYPMHDDISSSLTEQGHSSGWEIFSLERIQELQRKGIPVFVDFTAKWCLICQANHMILSKTDIQKKFADSGIVKMKADWTKNDPVITKELAKFGRSSVPLYVFYGADEPVILPQVLTPDTINQHIEEIIADAH